MVVWPSWVGLSSSRVICGVCVHRATGILGDLPLNCGNLSPGMEFGGGAPLRLCLSSKRTLPDLPGHAGLLQHCSRSFGHALSKLRDLYTFRPFFAPRKSAWPGFSSSKTAVKVCLFSKCLWGPQGASENPEGEHCRVGTVYNFRRKKKVKGTFKWILFWWSWPF